MIGRALLCGALAAAISVGTTHGASGSAGAGPVVGMIDYGGAAPPPLGAPCDAVAFGFRAASLTASVGTFAATGNGSGWCESALLGGGQVSADIDFVAVDGAAYDCVASSGSYSRTAGSLRMLLTGPCTVNGSAVVQVAWEVEVALVPDTPYGWFAGSFARLP